MQCAATNTHVKLFCSQSSSGQLRLCSNNNGFIHRTGYIACTQVYTRLDQPQTALQQYKKIGAEQAGQVDILLGQARIHDAINDLETGVTLYKEVMHKQLLADQGHKAAGCHARALLLVNLCCMLLYNG